MTPSPSSPWHLAECHLRATRRAEFMGARQAVGMACFTLAHPVAGRRALRHHFFVCSSGKTGSVKGACPLRTRGPPSSFGMAAPCGQLGSPHSHSRYSGTVLHVGDPALGTLTHLSPQHKHLELGCWLSNWVTGNRTWPACWGMAVPSPGVATAPGLVRECVCA